MKEELYTLEYSVSQRCFHIDNLDCILKKNLRNIKRQLAEDQEFGCDYMLIGIFKSTEECHKFSEELENTIYGMRKPLRIE